MTRGRPAGSTAPSPISPTDERAAPFDAWGAFCQLYVLTVVGLSILLASKFRELLDQKFRLDGDHIQLLLTLPDASLDQDDPFRNTAIVYRFLGLAGRPDIAAMLALGVFGMAVLLAIRWGELARMTPLGLAVITVCYVLALIYLSQFSKEFISLLLVVVVLALPRGALAEMILIGAMIGYAITIRPYWGIVVALYVVGRILLPRVRGLLPVLLGVLVTYVGLQILFNSFLGEALSFSRVAVNELRDRINISVGSMIVDFLPDQVGLQWLNAFLVFLSLVLPWPLLLGGSPLYLVMGGVLAVLWGLVGWALRRLQREHGARAGHRPSPPERSAPLSERTPRPERAVALLLALVVVQAIFEPDYGSYLKHIAPMLPLFVALLPLTPLTRANRTTTQGDRA